MKLGVRARESGGVLSALKQGRTGAWVLLVGAIVGFFFPGMLRVGRAAASPGELTRVARIHELAPEEAAKGLPVRIRGTVLCYDLAWNQLYLRQGTTTDYLPPAQLSHSFEQGQFIEVTGETCLEGGKPGFTNLSAKVLGQRPVPQAARVSLSEVGLHGTEWIEAVGQVRIAETSRDRLGLLLRDGDHSCIVWVMGNSGKYPYKSLFGCRVKVRGIGGTAPAGSTVSSASITAAGLNDISILERPKTNPLDVPVVALESLFTRELGDWVNEAVHLNALVASYSPGKTLLLKGVTGSIEAEVLQASPLKPDERVDLWGYLHASPEGVVLKDSFFEVLTKEQPKAPVQDEVPNLAVITNLPPLTNILAVTALPPEKLAQHYPVRLRGTITYADPEWHVHFLQDGTDAIFVDTAQADLRPGQFIELTGFAEQGGYMPQVSHATAKVLTMTNMPRAIVADLEDVADGHLDSHWVQIEGIVRRCAVEEGHLQMVLMTRKGKFSAIVPQYQESSPPTWLLDSRVLVSGACTTTMNRQGQLTGINLNVPAVEYIQNPDPVPADVFSGTNVPIASIATYDPNRLVGHRTKIGGTVTFCGSKEIFYMQDGSGGIRVSARGTNTVRVGERVEALGFQGVDEYAPCLDEASVRVMGRGGKLPVVKTTAEELLRDLGQNGCLVELEARLVQAVRPALRTRLVLQDGPILFTAQLAGLVGGTPLDGLESGAVVRVKGVCVMQFSDAQIPQGLRVLVADARDVVVLQKPSWWTAGRTITAVCILLGVMVIALGWIWMLRRQVRRQTEVIQQKLLEREEFAEKLAQEKQLLATLIDHLPDHVFARDAQGRYLLTNQRYCQFHGLPSQEQLIGQTLQMVFPMEMARRRKDTDEEIFRGTREIISEEEHLKNAAGEARWILTTRVPLKDTKGTVFGLVGISRDVTERKRAEAEMERMHRQLLDTSRQAGMAEVATSVLHNVGNVLNSVNVSTTMLTEQVRGSRMRKVRDISELLAANAADLGRFFTSDPKGRQLPGYFDLLADGLAREQAEVLQELESLTRNIEHIKDIVAMQQNYAKVRGVVETVAVIDLVEDALRMNAGALDRHGLSVRREYDRTLPPITVEKHKVLQILINLIRNAKYACDESGRTDKQLTVRIRNGDGRIKISIEDNGIGIPAENLTRIFNHGFTTRKAGHGFGLHSGALTAQELAGTLQAHSDGVGRGARFTLELPVSPNNS